VARAGQGTSASRCPSLVPLPSPGPFARGLLALGMLAAVAACTTKQQAASLRTGQGEAAPVIDVRPGVAERLALMDAYRLNDDLRKHLTRRPHVTVEELPVEEPAEEEDAGAAEAAEPDGPTATGN
jgi:hypothetical protein